MIKVDCTHCTQPIGEVFYSLIARDVRIPTGVITGEGVHLHYDCVPAYFGWLASGDRHTRAVFAEVAAERVRQDEKWGEQNHPGGTGPDVCWQLDVAVTDSGVPEAISAADAARIYRQITQAAAKDGELTWRDIALEEIAEAFAEDNPERLRAELVQTAAVFVAWVEGIDRWQRAQFMKNAAAIDRRANHPRNASDSLRCPSCDSPQPSMHPAAGDGGEVTRVCADPFHGPIGTVE